MIKLNSLENVVLEILKIDDLAKRDDCYLILKVIQKLYPLDTAKTFAEVMLGAKNKGISFESITRCRRKLQKKYPELKDDKVAKARNKKQKEYIEYSNQN